MRSYLELVVGDEFVCQYYWDRIKTKAEWPPADVSIHDQSIVYTVPSTQVAFANLGWEYEIWTDMGAQTVECKCFKKEQEFPFHGYGTLRVIQRDQDAVFRLLDTCVFSDVEIITRHLETNVVMDSHPFKCIFKEVYRCPMADRDWWRFQTDPRYEITIQTPSPCSPELLLEFCQLTLD